MKQLTEKELLLFEILTGVKYESICMKEKDLLFTFDKIEQIINLFKKE